MVLFRTVAALLLLFAAAAHAEKLAITFDDLPLNGELAPGMTRVGIVDDVLKILRRHRVPQVYGFINAAKLEGDTAADGALALKHWVAGGQAVGNHTYSHLDLHKSTPEVFLAEVRRNEPALALLDAKNAWHWLRYPYLREGDTLEKRREVAHELHERGYRIAQVTLDHEDYLWNSAYAHCFAAKDEKQIAWLKRSYLDTASAYIDADREMAQLVFGHKINHVLLLHLGAFSKVILPDLLDLLRTKGFELVTLAEAQSDPAYATDPDAASKYGGTLLEQWMDARALPYPKVAPKPNKELAAVCKAP